MKKTKQKTYFVFVDNSGFDSETECKVMTGDEIRDQYNKEQTGIAIVEGNLIKNFDSKIDLKRL